jgi:hypothetical protein
VPKSRRRKNRKTPRVTKAEVDRRTREILDGQRQRFREKFGRDWGDDDPVFFDPDADSPTPISAVKMEADVLDAMPKAGTPPQIMYAYKRTGGLILTEEMRDHWPPDRVQEWDAAIDEYFAIENAKAEGNLPAPSEWTTEIAELLTSGFTRDDLATVHEIMRAVAPIEARPPGLKVVQRIELAACSWLRRVTAPTTAPTPPAQWDGVPSFTHARSRSSSAARERFTGKDARRRVSAFIVR